MHKKYYLLIYIKTKSVLPGKKVKLVPNILNLLILNEY